jgi:hypothetical protein
MTVRLSTGRKLFINTFNFKRFFRGSSLREVKLSADKSETETTNELGHK